MKFENPSIMISKLKDTGKHIIFITLFPNVRLTLSLMAQVWVGFLLFLSVIPKYYVHMSSLVEEQIKF